MNENLQQNFHQGERKRPTDAKMWAIIRWKRECEKCSITLCKIFGRQNMQNQTDTKHSSNPKSLFE